MASVTIAELELQITSSTNQAVNGINSLITTLNSLKETVKGGLRLKLVTDQINKLGMAIKLFPNLNKLEQLRDILAQIKGIGDVDIKKSIKQKQLPTTGQASSNEIKEAQQQEEELGETAENTAEQFTQGANAVNSVAQAISALDESPFADLEKEIKRITERIQLFKDKRSILEGKLVDETDEEKINRILITLNTLEGTITNLEHTKIKLTDELEEKKLEQTADGTKQVTKQTKKLNKELDTTEKTAKKSVGVLGKFMKSLGRIAMYRAIRFLLKEIITAFKEGINNLYQFSKSMDGSFAQSMDKISSAILNIRNSLGVALAPFIEALAPAIEKLSDVFMEFGNKVSQVGAIMNGKTTYTKAVKSMREYAEATEKAKTATQGFDQLNIASKDATDYSSMFEEVALEDESEGAMKNFGEILKTIKEIITDIVTFLMPEIRQLVGYLMPIIETILGKVLGYIKNILPNLTEILGKVFAIVGALLEQLQPVIDNILNDGIGNIINEILGLINLLLDELMPVISTIFELLEPIGSLIGGIIYVLADIIHSVVNSLKPGIEIIGEILAPIIKVVVEVLKPVIEVISDVIQVIGSVLSAISETVGPLFETIKEIGKAFIAIFTEDTDTILVIWGTLGNRLHEIWSNAWNRIKDIFGNVWDRIKDKFMNTLYSMGEFGVKFVNKLIDGLNALGNPLIQILKTFGVEIEYIEHINPQWLQDWKASQSISQNVETTIVGSGQTEMSSASSRQNIEELKQEIRAMKGLDKNQEIELNVYLSGKQIKAEYDRLDKASGVRIGTGGALAY